METGAHQMYKFMTTNMTFPLLVGLGTLYVPWNDLIAAFTPAYFAICAATVLCGELSLRAAQTNPGELMAAHLRLERGT